MKNFYTLLFLFTCCTFQAQDYKFGKVSKEEVLETVHPLDKEANAAVLYRNVSTYYEYNDSQGFTLVTNVHERIKIYNKDGFEWATRELSYYKDGSTRENISGLKGSTYNIIDGKLVDEKLKKNGIFEEEATKYQIKTKFTMPAVTVGSVIEYEYSLRSPFLTSIDDMVLQYTIPINKLEASVRIPEFLSFKKHFNTRSPLNFPIVESSKIFSLTSTSIERGGGMLTTHNSKTSKVEYNQNIYSLEKENIPALKAESYIDYLQNYAAVLKWELQYTKFPNSIMELYSQSWEDVSKTIYSGSYEQELGRTGYFEKDLDKLLEGAGDPAEKAAKIYGFVKNKIKWNGYLGFTAENGGKAAYKDGEGNIGDINLALIAMLRYAGLNAYPILVSTKNNGTPLFPTRKGFNYVIAAVELGEKYFLLDATDENTAFGDLPGRARNWNGRILIDKENSDWVSLMPGYQSIYNNQLNLQLDENLNIKGKSINIITGHYATSYRDNYKNINTEDYIAILEKGKGNFAVSELVTENQSKIGEDIKETYNFEMQNAIEKINDKIYITPLLFLAERENPFKADKREYPVIFDFPLVETKTINIMLPEGYDVDYLPESAVYDLNGGAGTFKFLTAKNGKFLRVESRLDLKNTVYSPQDYTVLKDFYAQLVMKHSEAIVLSKT